MVDNILEKAAEMIGENFSVEIVDGVMEITPAEAGIALFGYIKMTEHEVSNYEDQVSRIADRLLEIGDDNAKLRDILESVVPVLEATGNGELAAEILRVVYPVAGITDEGTEVKFDGEE